MQTEMALAEELFQRLLTVLLTLVFAVIDAIK